MKRAQFVAIRIAKVSEIRPTWANTGRIFDGGAAIRHSGFVPGVGLLGTSCCEANRAAVGMSGWLPINRLGHQKQPTIVGVNQPPLFVLPPGLPANRANRDRFRRPTF